MKHQLHLRPLLWMALALMATCDLPRDPNNTLERVRGGTMRVGYVSGEPWVIARSGGGEPTGVEPALLREFARELDARIEWVEGAESELMQALEYYRLDAVVGGVTRASPWGQRVTFTKPYHTSAVGIGVPPSAPPFRAGDLEGQRVAVETGDPTAAHLEDEGAIPVTVPDLSLATGPVAAAEWKLRALDLRPTGIVLHRNHHVIAVPPGENGWLVRFERFLHGRQAEIERIVAEERQRVAR